MRCSKILATTILLCLLTCLCYAAEIDEIASIRINKGIISPQEAKVYFDMLDSQGHTRQDTIPDDFTALIGSSQATIKEVKPFSLTGEGIAYVILVDLSPSLAKELPAIQEMLTAFVNKMAPADRALLMTAGNEISVVQNFSADKESLKSALASLIPATSPTRDYQGLFKALDAAILADPSLPTRRAVVMVSGDEQTTNTTNIRQQLLEKLLTEKVPIYAVSYAQQKNNAAQNDLDILLELARYSGGAYYQSQAAIPSPAAVYADILRDSKAGFVAYLSHPPLTNTTTRYPLQLTLKSGDKLFTHTVETKVIANSLIIPQNDKHDPLTVPQFILQYAYYLLSGLAAILLLFFASYRLRRHTTVPQATAEIQKAIETAACTTAPQSFFHCQAPPANVSSPQCLHILLSTSRIPVQTVSFDLTASLRIGSSAAHSHLTIADEAIEPLHLALSAEAGKLFVTGLAATSDTLVNGVPIKYRVQLHDGDTLRIGQTEMRVTF